VCVVYLKELPPETHSPSTAKKFLSTLFTDDRKSAANSPT
jgi:hypothetical protein